MVRFIKGEGLFEYNSKSEMKIATIVMANPSIPSMKFIAFIIDNITKIVNS